jgi:hypothetical protein
MVIRHLVPTSRPQGPAGSGALTTSLKEYNKDQDEPQNSGHENATPGNDGYFWSHVDGD